jgi:ABC-type multidrug transport system ATPase subunit/peptidoglycan/LPS O-acetylase OafA/YrhL
MSTSTNRLHALDAVRGFALLLGVVLHAAMSFLPGFGAMGWPLADVSPSVPLGLTFYVIHVFRMTLFFVIAGFFGHLLYHRLGVRGFIRNRSVRIVVPLVVGWIVVFPLLAVSFSWAMSQSGTTAPGTPIPPEMIPRLAFPLTHLWFLYVLVWLYAGTLLVRSVVARWVDSNGSRRVLVDRVVRALVTSFAAPFVLAVPVFLAMTSGLPWARWFGITTPDQSLIPNVVAAAAFSTAFAFGWLVDRQRDLLQAWQRQWPVYLAAAIALTAACLSIAGLTPVFVPAPIDSQTRLYAALYAVASWAWTFAIIGMAMRYFSDDSPKLRYVSDASYWIYVMHLPVIFLLQAALKTATMHWSVKFLLIVSLALGLLFASYHVLVRRTLIGEVLNGRRHRASTGSPAQPSAAPGSWPPAELVSARKKYGDTLALDGIDLQVRPGELLAVLGPNGAGKSTAISLMLGLLEPDEGQVRLFGRSPHDTEARCGVGVMMQEVALAPELRVRELIDLTTRYYPSPMTPDEAMRLTNTTELRNRPYAKLSTGQKRQVQFALAICGKPALLFLDEPTVGLDVDAREGFWSTIRQLVSQGVSVVLTTHYLEEAEALADRVIVLAKGRVIAAGSVDEIRSVVDRKRIRCVTTLAPDDIRTWPGVVSVAHDGRALVVMATDADAVVRRMLNADTGARELEIERAGLAEAFSALTKEAA